MKKMTMDANTAACYVSYAFSEIAVIYPITPSSPMAELADLWQAQGKTNLFGNTVRVVEMQSESGAAGTLHGALSCGALTTTYTCSQGLLLMQPNMFKIAGELLPTVFHVSARALSTHALSIFGDHQDVMACRQTGFAMLFSSSVQESMDLALVSHIATLRTSVPFMHIFDGFRTSHEMQKIECFEEQEMASLLPRAEIEQFRARALDPERPIARGTQQAPDTYFQARERANSYYEKLPAIVQQTMDEVAKITKRAYRVFDYFGSPNAKTVAVMLGSGGCVMQETIEKCNEQGENYGLIKVRLYRPFDALTFCKALPKTCENIVVLDRTKEHGSIGEPLYLDVVTALQTQGISMKIVDGRYGLGSKDFTPAHCFAVLKNAESPNPKHPFTVGIIDDETHLSLDIPPFFILSNDTISCKFYGLGSDGSVGANKNAVKIIGDHTDLFVQAYFSYDSRKSGGITISHLRFGKKPILSSYLIDRADFVSCNDPSYPFRYDILSDLKENGVLLYNCPYTDEKSLNAYLPPAFKKKIAEKHVNFFVINATEIAISVGLSGRTGLIMQTAFFLLQKQILPYPTALSLLKKDIEKLFSSKGEKVVQANFLALDKVEDAVKKIEYTDEWTTVQGLEQEVEPTKTCQENDEYYQTVMRPILALQGDTLPVSAFSPDGSMPTGTTKYEKPSMPALLPFWIEENCIQCNQCSFVCPHATIRPFVFSEDTKMPENFTSKSALGVQNARFRIQVAPYDCKGCGVCAQTCPTKEKALVMRPFTNAVGNIGELWDFAVHLPKYPLPPTPIFRKNTVKGSQFSTPLFEFSYACAGCGETPYIRLLTQLFGEKTIIANATGCSSIYGGTFPACPYTKNEHGQGPAWANSLFEDNAEFGLGMRLAWDTRSDLQEKKEKSVWIIGGDGWAYDIGFGGLDHVLATNENVNVLVLDSQVYSNTGGQTSKATPTGAKARFAVNGKRAKRKNLAASIIPYGTAYVAQVSMGANKQQLLTALMEAESFQGPSLIIAYSPCIAHGVNLSECMEEEKLAVESGFWQLFRFNPRKMEKGENPFSLDSKPPTIPLRDFFNKEKRFSLLQNDEVLLAQAEKDCKEKREYFEKLSRLYQP